MASIQVRILSGAAAGKQLRLGESSVRFGRDPACEITIDQSFVSHDHGRLAFDNGRWQLQNHSSNATMVGKRRVGSRARTISGPTTVSVGDEPIFEIIAVDTAPATAEPSRHSGRDQSSDGQGSSSWSTPTVTGRTKLWIGIGAYLVVMFGLFVFFSYGLNGKRQTHKPKAPQLSPAQIERQIRQPMDKRPPDPRRAGIHAENALGQFNKRKTNPGALYRALGQYKLAQAYTSGYRLKNPTDERRFAYIKDLLTKRLTQAYRQAYNRKQNRNFQGAINGFRRVQSLYPNPNSLIYQNAQTHRDLAKQQRAKRNG